MEERRMVVASSTIDSTLREAPDRFELSLGMLGVIEVLGINDGSNRLGLLLLPLVECALVPRGQLSIVLGHQPFLDRTFSSAVVLRSAVETFVPKLGEVGRSSLGSTRLWASFRSCDGSYKVLHSLGESIDHCLEFLLGPWGLGGSKSCLIPVKYRANPLSGTEGLFQSVQVHL